MELLITGAAGSVGKHFAEYFAKRGYALRLFDLRQEGIPSDLGGAVRAFVGSVSDRELVAEAVRGVDAVIHLAWSFSEEPVYLLEEDLRGHLYLLEAACEHRVKKFLYASTATVYGRALTRPVSEDHPCLALESRKPLYALAKVFAEDLCRLYQQERGLAAIIFRFWWAFGDEISGRHLRAMAASALRGETIEVPADAGGTFVTMEDLAQAFELALEREAKSQVYNIGSFFASWEEIAGMIAEETGQGGKVRVVPVAAWQGPRFLSDCWELGFEKACTELGFRPALSREEGLRALRRALKRLVAQLAEG